MNHPDVSNRDLLFGLLALQNGFIDQGNLFSAFHTWTRDKNQSMAEILERQGSIDRDAALLISW